MTEKKVMVPVRILANAAFLYYKYRRPHLNIILLTVDTWEHLPYWKPYRIRVSPYGLEEYWSDWLEINLEK